MRTRLRIVCLLCAVLSACTEENRPASTEVVLGDIAVPDAILTARAIERQRLKPTFTITGGTNPGPHELRLEGNSYTRKFALPNENFFDLTVYWDYEVDDRVERLPLARTDTRRISLMSARVIAVSQDDYDTDFDEDGDGTNNIDELAAGRDPYVRDGVGDLPGAQLKAAALATLRSDQADCLSMAASSSVLNVGADSTDTDVHMPILGATTTHAPELVDNQRVYTAQVALTEAGTLSISALGGQPDALRVSIHDRKADTLDDADLAWIEAHGIDERLDVALRNGLYCLTIRDAGGESPADWRALSDLVLSIALQPTVTSR